MADTANTDIEIETPPPAPAEVVPDEFITSLSKIYLRLKLSKNFKKAVKPV